jgi:hypothetical protein
MDCSVAEGAPLPFSGCFDGDRSTFLAKACPVNRIADRVKNNGTTNASMKTPIDTVN